MASADMSISPTTVGVEGEGAMSAGEFVLKKLFAEFVVLSERKLQEIASQPPVSDCGSRVFIGWQPWFLNAAYLHNIKLG